MRSSPPSPSISTVADLTERELVARVQQHLPPPPDWLLVGIGDDAAVVAPARNRLEVLTVDALVEGVHFDRRFTPAAAIGHRAMAVNLSDLAAMGAAPRLALLSFALPASLPACDFDNMLAGMAAIASRYDLHVAGGNLTRSPGPLVIDVTMTGTAKPRQPMTRRGARPGDGIYVTGVIGAAAAGLAALQASATIGADLEPCVQRFLYPEPRVRAGLLLARNRAASACMDLSDGLADAVTQVTAQSGVGAFMDAEELPVDPGARSWFESRGEDAVTESITGGDDYELLFTVHPRFTGRLATAMRHAEVPFTRIGICTDDGSVRLRRKGVPDSPLPRGFDHFR